MILVETNMSNAENDLYMINGYNSIFINRKRRGAGIAVYIKKQIGFSSNHANNKFFESIEVDIIYNQQNIMLLPIYRPRHLMLACSLMS